MKKKKGLNRERTSKNKNEMTVGKTAILVVLSIILVVMIWGANTLADANNLVESSYKPRANSSTVNGQKLTDINKDINPLKDPISILILGVDDDTERQLGSARTDTMILATINPEKEKISMVSIPRDTYTKIDTAKFQGMDKINAAYSYGTEDASIQAVQDLLNVPINYYATIDFIAFEKVINDLGGIEVDVPYAVVEGDATGENAVFLEPGLQNLDGNHALAYARTRHKDNDIERGKRQQIVIQKVIEKSLNLGSISKYSKMMSSIEGHIWTDMKTDAIMGIAQSGLTNNYTFDSYTFDWSSFKYDNGYSNGGELPDMVSLFDDSLEYVSHKLRLSLNLDEKDYRDEKSFVFQTNGVPSDKTYPEYGAIDN